MGRGDFEKAYSLTKRHYMVSSAIIQEIVKYMPFGIEYI
jgi:hypothetical protein